MLKSITLFTCLILLISTIPTYSSTDFPDDDFDSLIGDAFGNNDDNMPDIDLVIKENSSIPNIDIPVNNSLPNIDLKIEEFKLPNVTLTIKENSTIPHIDIPVNNSLPDIDLKIEEFKLPNVDLSIKENSTIPNIDIPINNSLPNIDIKIENFKLPEVDLDIKGASDKSFTMPNVDIKVDETKAVKKNDIDIDEDADTEDSDDEDEGVVNKKGVCDITLITPEGKLYERMIHGDKKSNKLRADSNGILFLVVNTHTCLCKITGLALHKENRNEKPFLKVKPTEKELQTTYQFPFPVKIASFKCSNTAA